MQVYVQQPESRKGSLIMLPFLAQTNALLLLQGDSSPRDYIVM